MYTKAFSTLGCAGLSLAQVIELGRRFDVGAFELRALRGTLDLPAYLDTHYGTPAALRREVDAAEVRIVALDTSFRLIGNSAADRAALLAFVPWAEGLGVRWLRVFDGGEGLDPASLAQARESLGWWARQRHGQGLAVDLMVETHDVLLDAERIENFITQMGGAPVSLLWDAHHTWKKGGELPTVTWPRIQPHVVHVHVKDSVSAAPPSREFSYVLPGRGEFPFADLRARLAASFDGAVSLEWERHWHPSLPPLEEALASARLTAWW